MVSNLRRSDPTVVAFVAATTQTGRTSMVANVGWIMASVGRRALAIDWGSESPVLHSYLQPFAIDTKPDLPEDLRLAIENAVVPANSSRRVPGLAARGTRYALPGLPAHLDVIRCAESESPATVRLLTEGARELRPACQASGYDNIMVDLPTVSGEFEADPVTELCDVAVVSFLPRDDGPAVAERMVRELLDAGRGRVRVVAVPSVFDIAASPRARRDTNLVLQTFRDLNDRPEFTIVDVPFRPDFSTFKALAVLVDEPGQSGTRSLAHAYERVAEKVTGGAVKTQHPVPAQVRSSYRVSLGMGESVDPVWLAYAPPDRPLADWIAAQVRASGVPVRRLPAGGAVGTGGTVIAVLSQSFVESPIYTAVRTAVAGGDRRAIGVTVEADVAVDHAMLAEQLNLTGLDPDIARRRLLAAAWIFEPAASGPPTMRLPEIAAPATLAERQPDTSTSTHQSHTDVPSPSPRFVGRESLLDHLRDRLSPLDEEPGQDYMRVVQVIGPPGIGKSELARAYAARFAGMYERVWWIPAGDRRAVRARLSELAGVLQLSRSAEPAESALASLRRESDAQGERWLLIYDNAVSEAVDGLLPAGGSGDVIITAGNEIPGYPGTPVGVDVLDELDARALLRDETIGLRRLSEEDARRVAKELGHLPVGMILGAAWLRDRYERNRRMLPDDRAIITGITELLEQLNHERRTAPDLSPVHRMAALTLRTMSELPSPFGALATALARMCVFLSPDGVSVRLLRSQRTIAELARLAGDSGELLLDDEVQLDQVLSTGVRFGLFEVDHAQPAVLRIHRVVQQTIRGLTEPALLRAAQAATLHSLGGYCPTGMESDPQYGRDLKELQAHLDPSAVATYDFTDPEAVQMLGDAGLPGTGGWAVRRWLVSQVRHMFGLRSQETSYVAVTLADEVSRTWTAAFGERDGLVGRLDAQRANLYRWLGDHERALQIDMRLLAIQRRDLGTWHPRTLMTARGFGGDLRALGRFAEALAEDEATWLGFRQAFGEAHPETLMVAHNLTVSRQLMGNLEGAYKLALASYEQRVRVFGEAHPWTAGSRRALATYLCELGRYDDALRHLVSNLDTLKEFHPQHEHTEELRSARVKLTVERRTGRRAINWIVEQGADLLERYRRRFGDQDVRTHVCHLSHAVDVHVAGRSARAIDLANVSLDGYVRAFSVHHPYSSATRANLALFQHSAGRVDEALATGEQVLNDLRDELDPLHPWTLAAAVNHATVLASAGRWDAATRLLTDTHDHCLEFLGERHPTTVAAEHNLRVHQGVDEIGKPRWRELDIDLN